MKFFLLINVKMPTTVGILTYMSQKNSILGLFEPKKAEIFIDFYTYEHLKFHAQLSWAFKKFYNLGPWLHITDVGHDNNVHLIVEHHQRTSQYISDVNKFKQPAFVFHVWRSLCLKIFQSWKLW